MSASWGETIGLFGLLLAGAGFCLVIHLAGVQARGLTVRTLPPDERLAIEAELREQEHALRALFDIRHPIRDPGPDIKFP